MVRLGFAFAGQPKAAVPTSFIFQRQISTTCDCKQTGALVWHERAVGDLAIECAGPAAGHLVVHIGAAAFGSQAIVGDKVSVTADQRLVALGAARVFPLFDHAGEIASVDVTEAGVAADLDRAQEIFDGRVSLILHFVIGVKGSDVPGDVGRDAGHEFGELAKFVVGVVEAGDEQGDDLEPQSHRVDAADAVEDGADAATEFVVVAVVEALQIDFVEIEPRAHVVENLRRAVAVGDESGKKAGGLGFFENCDRPFAGDERLVVGADQNFRALIKGIAYESLRSGCERRRDGIGIAQGLRRHPVLAVSAMQVAAEHAEAVGESAWISVEERLFFDGIALHAGGVSPGDVEFAAAIEADFADSWLAFGNGQQWPQEKQRTRLLPRFSYKGRICFADSLVEDVAEGGHGKPLGLF